MASSGKMKEDFKNQSGGEEKPEETPEEASNVADPTDAEEVSPIISLPQQQLSKEELSLTDRIADSSESDRIADDPDRTADTEPVSEDRGLTFPPYPEPNLSEGLDTKLPHITSEISTEMYSTQIVANQEPEEEEEISPNKLPDIHLNPEPPEEEDMQVVNCSYTDTPRCCCTCAKPHGEDEQECSVVTSENDESEAGVKEIGQQDTGIPAISSWVTNTAPLFRENMECPGTNEAKASSSSVLNMFGISSLFGKSDKADDSSQQQTFVVKKGGTGTPDCVCTCTCKPCASKKPPEPKMTSKCDEAIGRERPITECEILERILRECCCTKDGKKYGNLVPRQSGDPSSPGDGKKGGKKGDKLDDLLSPITGKKKGDAAPMDKAKAGKKGDGPGKGPAAPLLGPEGKPLDKKECPKLKTSCDCSVMAKKCRESPDGNPCKEYVNKCCKIPDDKKTECMKKDCTELLKKGMKNGGPGTGAKSGSAPASAGPSKGPVPSGKNGTGVPEGKSSNPIMNWWNGDKDQKKSGVPDSTKGKDSPLKGGAAAPVVKKKGDEPVKKGPLPDATAKPAPGKVAAPSAAGPACTPCAPVGTPGAGSPDDKKSWWPFNKGSSPSNGKCDPNWSDPDLKYLDTSVILMQKAEKGKPAVALIKHSPTGPRASMKEVSDLVACISSPSCEISCQPKKCVKYDKQGACCPPGCPPGCRLVEIDPCSPCADIPPPEECFEATVPACPETDQTGFDADSPNDEDGENTFNSEDEPSSKAKPAPPPKRAPVKPSATHTTRHLFAADETLIDAVEDLLGGVPESNHDVAPTSSPDDDSSSPDDFPPPVRTLYKSSVGPVLPTRVPKSNDSHKETRKPASSNPIPKHRMFATDETALDPADSEMSTVRVSSASNNRGRSSAHSSKPSSVEPAARFKEAGSCKQEDTIIIPRSSSPQSPASKGSLMDRASASLKNILNEPKKKDAAGPSRSGFDTCGGVIECIENGRRRLLLSPSLPARIEMLLRSADPKNPNVVTASLPSVPLRRSHHHPLSSAPSPKDSLGSITGKNIPPVHSHQKVNINNGTQQQQPAPVSNTNVMRLVRQRQQCQSHSEPQVRSGTVRHVQKHLLLSSQPLMEERTPRVDCLKKRYRSHRHESNEANNKGAAQEPVPSPVPAQKSDHPPTKQGPSKTQQKNHEATTSFKPAGGSTEQKTTPQDAAGGKKRHKAGRRKWYGTTEKRNDKKK